MRQAPDEAALKARRERLVDGLAERGYVTRPEVLGALKAVRRHLLVPERNHPDAYDDRPLDIGEGQTISAPHMVGIMADKLDLRPGLKVLEIGGGSGYHALLTSYCYSSSCYWGTRSWSSTPTSRPCPAPTQDPPSIRCGRYFSGL